VNGKKTPDTRVRAVSDAEAREEKRARELGHGRWLGSAQERNAGAGGRRETGRRWQAEVDTWKSDGPRALGCKEKRAKIRMKRISLFFLFPVFQNHFPKGFEIHFEFNSNHSIQNFKCSSMNAQLCFYPYI
jgi:hypothetical protein